MVRNITLNNGVLMPQIGFGTYKADREDPQVLQEAIACGYRHLDTASLYGNEAWVGQAVRESGLPRQEFFLVSKLNRNQLGYDQAKKGVEESLRNLQTDYLDLYLIHWPRPDYGRPDFEDWQELDRQTWKALEELYEQHVLRAIGVSNFLVPHLQNLLASASVVPAVDQIEYHPGYTQPETVDFCRQKGIAVEAWSPMGRGRLWQDPLLLELAAKYHTSVPHLCLVFAFQQGIAVIPKSTHPERMQENLQLEDVQIAAEDMQKILAMPVTGWSGEHPDRRRVYFQ